jgi:glycosyltransferase involved in cell wall biosynthesis
MQREQHNGKQVEQAGCSERRPSGSGDYSDRDEPQYIARPIRAVAVLGFKYAVTLWLAFVESREMLSVVVPVFNEAESLPLLYQELVDVAREHGYQWDIIFVDDGSTDGSWDVIERLAGDDVAVQGIRFRRNFGKAAALSAGFAAARGELVFTLDADLQDDPHEIPRFLAEIEKGRDVVSGWKQVRHDPWHKVGPSRVFNWLVGFMTGVKLHDHNCGFKCYRREIFDEVRLYGELHRFVPVLAAARGWSVGEIPVNHRARKYGASKYGVKRIVKGFLDLLTVYFLTGFHQRPAHLLGTLGLASFGLGLAGIVYLTIYWLISQANPQWQWDPLHTRPALQYSVAALLLGAQLLTVGFLAELITAYQGQTTPSYSVRGRVGNHVHRRDDAV